MFGRKFFRSKAFSVENFAVRIAKGGSNGGAGPPPVRPSVRTSVLGLPVRGSTNRFGSLKELEQAKEDRTSQQLERARENHRRLRAQRAKGGPRLRSTPNHNPPNHKPPMMQLSARTVPSEARYKAEQQVQHGVVRRIRTPINQTTQNHQIKQ